LGGKTNNSGSERSEFPFDGMNASILNHSPKFQATYHASQFNFWYRYCHGQVTRRYCALSLMYRLQHPKVHGPQTPERISEDKQPLGF
jgi:hypothetical protein